MTVLTGELWRCVVFERPFLFKKILDQRFFMILIVKIHRRPYNVFNIFFPLFDKIMKRLGIHKMGKYLLCQCYVRFFLSKCHRLWILNSDLHAYHKNWLQKWQSLLLMEGTVYIATQKSRNWCFTAVSGHMIHFYCAQL